jgi:hypothetical protein
MHDEIDSKQNTREFIQHLLDAGYTDIEGTCHDCKSPVKYDLGIDEEENPNAAGPVWHFTWAGPNTFMKCLGCFAKDPVLRNFRPTEVYSRVVGYLRPVRQWNLGKQSEFKTRTPFELGEERHEEAICKNEEGPST